MTVTLRRRPFDAVATVLAMAFVAFGCANEAVDETPEPQATPTNQGTAPMPPPLPEGSPMPEPPDDEPAPDADGAEGDEAAGAGAAALPSLQDRLDARNAEFSATAPAAMQQTFEEGIEAVAGSGVMASARKAGDEAPDFALPGPTGEEVRLSNLLEDGPVVITWYRGGWCPYCNIQLRAMQEALPAIEAAGGTLVAISPETPDNALTTAEQNDLAFHVLSDADNAVARRYGIAYTLPQPVADAFEGRIDLAAYNGNERNELPLSATYIIDTDGVIRYAFLDADYKKRAEPATVVAELEKL